MSHFSKSFFALAILALCSAPFASPVYGEEMRRGDYPACQQECVDRLRKDMTKLARAYIKDSVKSRYEEGVEGARAEFDRCIRDCRELIPVK